MTGLWATAPAVAADSPAKAPALTLKDLPGGFKAQVTMDEGMDSFYHRAEYGVTFTGAPQGSPFIFSRVLNDVKVYHSWSDEKFDWTYSQAHECSGLRTNLHFTSIKPHVGKHAFGCAWYNQPSKSYEVIVHFRRGVANVDLTVDWARSTLAEAETEAYHLATVIDGRI
jgi:hypothetical protein